METGLLKKRLEAGTELLDRQSADMFSVEPDGFWIEGVFLSEVNDGIGAVDALESESVGEVG